ncbi:methylated-DNA--[protein]-cysteine S-methyltransferase [Actinoplanes sp. N902-109]|uniref:methylated-DNA--[protein]-cysteine S-methyltransferase n=1 Tax=Actinoplanes sp. (strain N902-109) TaxID=649831 RepID=UPI0003295619|nr:methylated-DNA--[protein]-cysteine S-methyltransferase [Actinoplanes sp. N902-109]AGL20950.1 methylated-DNA/protein-cysteine methyltransferase [Actinoplanes sp. N902-109]
MMRSTTLDTPAGPFTYVVSAAGAVRAAGFTTDAGSLLPLVHKDLRDGTRPATEPGAVGEAVRSYFDGELGALDDVVVEQHTTGPFLAHAWQVMREIKPGHPVTYTGFAELAGRPAAVRAAATACARNAVALFVPCHRVIGTDGTLRGYRWGVGVKTTLLAHEAATTGR